MSATDAFRLAPTFKSTPTAILKNLVKILHDGQEGFRTASEDVTDADLKDLFCRLSLQRSKFAGELEAHLLTLGEDNPEKEGTTLAGDLHRGWIDFKAALTRKDRLAIIKETERGELTSVNTYNDALAHRELPGPIRDAILSQAGEIKDAYAEVVKLREAAEAAKKS